MKRLFISVITLSLLLAGCDPDRVYEQNEDISDAVWRAEDIKRFTFPIDDVSQAYDLSFNIRNTLSYPFQNIYINYELLDSVDNVIKSEMKQFYLFDSKTGAPQGDGMGDLFDNQFPIVEGHRFTRPGEYSVAFQQFMRLDSLPMVVSIGLRVARERTE